MDHFMKSCFSAYLTVPNVKWLSNKHCGRGSPWCRLKILSQESHRSLIEIHLE